MRIAVCLVMLACAFTPASLNAGLIGMELIVNGNAEAGNNFGWTGDFASPNTAANAGASGLSDASVIGDYSFFAGTGTDPKTLMQAIDISALASSIDAGEISFSFGILIQSRRVGSAFDLGTASLTFLDTGGSAIGPGLSFTDNIVGDPDFTWNAFGDAGAVPIGAREIRILLSASRNAGVSTDVFFDNASLKLESSAVVPEPSSLGLFAIGGLSLIGYRLRLRRKVIRRR